MTARTNVQGKKKKKHQAINQIKVNVRIYRNSHCLNSSLIVFFFCFGPHFMRQQHLWTSWGPIKIQYMLVFMGFFTCVNIHSTLLIHCDLIEIENWNRFQSFTSCDQLLPNYSDEILRKMAMIECHAIQLFKFDHWLQWLKLCSMHGDNMNMIDLIFHFRFLSHFYWILEKDSNNDLYEICWVWLDKLAANPNSLINNNISSVNDVRSTQWATDNPPTAMNLNQCVPLELDNINESILFNWWNIGIN